MYNLADITCQKGKQHRASCKFNGKADEGFFVGYSLNSKVFRVFNNRTKIVEENFHIRFSENTPNVVGSRPDWLFDIDAGTQSNGFTDLKSSQDDGFKPSSDDRKKVDEDPSKGNESYDQEKEDNVNNTNNVNTVSSTINDARTNRVNDVGKLLFDPDMPALEDVGTFNFSNEDEDDDAVTDMNNLDTTIQVSPTSTTRIHKDHPLNQVIGDLQLATQTRNMTKNLEEHEFVSTIQQRTNYKDLQNCLFACFLLQEEPKKIFKNKKDERGIVIRNKARLIAQGHTKEEGIDYDEVFAPVARIEAIRLFLAYASFKDFVVYQMDVKSAFLYEKTKQEVYVCQPSGFKDPNFLDRVYKVKKALYGLHQAPRAWYETLSTYLLDNGFQRGKIDKTLFIKRHKGDILLVQVYVDDIIFGSTRKELCNAFERLMHEKFQMSFMGELTFFLGLQVKQKKDGIFISQDKYVVEILKKFGFTEVKNASTPMETRKPVLKDEDGEEVDVHMYRTYYCWVNVNAVEEEFWSTSVAKTINEEAQIHDRVDGKKLIISEASIRRDLKLADEEGVDCLSNSTIFEQLASMGGHTLRSDDDRMKLNDLMKLCTNLQTRVIDLKKTKSTQANEIDSLKMRVNKLERRNKSRTHKLKRLYKVGLTARVESSDNEESLGEDASKQWRRIDDIDADEDITLVNDEANAEMFDVDKDLGGEEDKGKGIIVEEPVKHKKKEKIRLDEEAALKFQDEYDKEQRLAREKAEKELEANIALIETWDDVQAKIDVDHQLVERLQAEEKQESTDKEKATLFMQFLEKRRKLFAAKRAEKKRNKPPTQAQKRKIMCTYLKNMEGYTLKQLKEFEFDKV
nr:hypothetical protein [Tanacetum cinerariifolium]